MTSIDGQGHLLSLKVMRVSRPGLASAWEPFYSSSPSFSAHSTASVLSLQGKSPLPGHPKTLRDLTHVSEFLTLPAAFGAVQLGETFSSCICVNNESNVQIEGVSVSIEMQTANSKTVLAELGGLDYRLTIADALEHVIHHEVKELGQHVLSCTVSYRLPLGFHHPPGPADGSNDPSVQSFRKFYKFAVTNPLSVKTKVHTPKSPSALRDPLEREKTFLEVHIQNMTQEPMWFERMELECIEGWSAVDANHLSRASESSGDNQLFSGSMALMQPQAVRQYIYILSPSTIPSFPVSPQPGSIIPLGRLDIAWRSQFGKPGRLLTSMLCRRIPGQPPPPPSSVQQPASAVPPYLQRGPPGTPSSPLRARSPQLPPSRPSSPPPGSFRPGSPFRNRPAPIVRPQSPAGSISSVSAPATQPLSIQPNAPDLDVDLVVVHKPEEPTHVGKPFQLGFKLTVSALVPRSSRQRAVSIVVQHLFPLHPAVVLGPPVSAQPSSSRFSSYEFSPPPSQPTPMVDITRETVSSPQKLTRLENDAMLSLPPPYFEIPDEVRSMKLKGCSFLGPSAITLDPINLISSNDPMDDELIRAEGSQLFELTFQPLRTGFVCVGGLRLILTDDKLSDADNAPYRRSPQILKELDIVAEIWVRS
ncbi:DUF974-domain-containing protein [Phlebopus sp. FC_14]|nr:DUF974-domain-containing protein [Phlebopus sp. FC_14]